MATEKQLLQDKLNEIEKKEREDIRRVHYPEFKKQFQGKCFKSKNGYGGGSKGWWYYTKVLCIKPEYIYDTKGTGITSHFDGYGFEVTTDGNVSIRDIDKYYVHSLGEEITEEEFNKAWNKMVEKINKFQ